MNGIIVCGEYYGFIRIVKFKLDFFVIWLFFGDVKSNFELMICLVWFEGFVFFSGFESLVFGFFKSGFGEIGGWLYFEFDMLWVV